MPRLLTPLAFHQAIDYVHASSPGNATIRALFPIEAKGADTDLRDEMAAYVGAVQAATDHYGDIMARLAGVLADLGAKAVAPMAKNQRESNIAIALYAGDGIVIKLINNRYVNHDLRPESFIGSYAALPGVLPPIRSMDVKGFKVEVYPWIDRMSVTEADVESMNRTLADYNLKFKPGDDRPDNIGVLPGPGRKLAVLDIDAVELLNPHLDIATNDVHRWTKEMHQRFAPLYTVPRANGQELALLSDQPDFREAFSHLLTAESARKPKPGGQKGYSR